MKYQDKSFNFGPGVGEVYRSNWERIFSKKNKKAAKQSSITNKTTPASKPSNSSR